MTVTKASPERTAMKVRPLFREWVRVPPPPRLCPAQGAFELELFQARPVKAYHSIWDLRLSCV